MIDEGYVKFQADWRMGPAPSGIATLVAARNQLHGLGLIGEYPDLGIGYGNISVKIAESLKFVISGSATGGIREATAAHFCTVTAFDIDGNVITCEGPVTASSESLTHAMLYACTADIGAVVHVHHQQFWEYLLQTAPCSADGVAYGTPAMAREMARLMAHSELPQRRILAMTGHPEGIITIGPTLQSAVEKILEEYGEWGRKVGEGY